MLQLFPADHQTDLSGDPVTSIMWKSGDVQEKFRFLPCCLKRTGQNEFHCLLNRECSCLTEWVKKDKTKDPCTAKGTDKLVLTGGTTTGTLELLS